jgi:hypothetical protein
MKSSELTSSPKMLSFTSWGENHGDKRRGVIPEAAPVGHGVDMPVQFNLKAKVASKGGVSVYGLGQRWPVTLYPDQWEALSKAMPNILKFIEDNKADCEAKAAANAESTKGAVDDTGRVTL